MNLLSIFAVIKLACGTKQNFLHSIESKRSIFLVQYIEAPEKVPGDSSMHNNFPNRSKMNLQITEVAIDTKNVAQSYFYEECDSTLNSAKVTKRSNTDDTFSMSNFDMNKAQPSKSSDELYRDMDYEDPQLSRVAIQSNEFAKSNLNACGMSSCSKSDDSIQMSANMNSKRDIAVFSLETTSNSVINRQLTQQSSEITNSHSFQDMSIKPPYSPSRINKKTHLEFFFDHHLERSSMRDMSLSNTYEISLTSNDIKPSVKLGTDEDRMFIDHSCYGNKRSFGLSSGSIDSAFADERIDDDWKSFSPIHPNQDTVPIELSSKRSAEIHDKAPAYNFSAKSQGIIDMVFGFQQKHEVFFDKLHEKLFIGKDQVEIDSDSHILDNLLKTLENEENSIIKLMISQKTNFNVCNFDHFPGILHKMSTLSPFTEHHVHDKYQTNTCAKLNDSIIRKVANQEFEIIEQIRLISEHISEQPNILEYTLNSQLFSIPKNQLLISLVKMQAKTRMYLKNEYKMGLLHEAYNSFVHDQLAIKSILFPEFPSMIFLFLGSFSKKNVEASKSFVIFYYSLSTFNHLIKCLERNEDFMVIFLNKSTRKNRLICNFLSFISRMSFLLPIRIFLNAKKIFIQKYYHIIIKTFILEIKHYKNNDSYAEDISFINDYSIFCLFFFRPTKVYHVLKAIKEKDIHFFIDSNLTLIDSFKLFIQNLKQNDKFHDNAPQCAMIHECLQNYLNIIEIYSSKSNSMNRESEFSD